MNEVKVSFYYSLGTLVPRHYMLKWLYDTLQYLATPGNLLMFSRDNAEFVTATPIQVAFRGLRQPDGKSPEVYEGK